MVKIPGIRNIKAKYHGLFWSFERIVWFDVDVWLFVVAAESVVTGVANVIEESFGFGCTVRKFSPLFTCSTSSCPSSFS